MPVTSVLSSVAAAQNGTNDPLQTKLQCYMSNGVSFQCNSAPITDKRNEAKLALVCPIISSAKVDCDTYLHNFYIFNHVVGGSVCLAA